MGRLRHYTYTEQRKILETEMKRVNNEKLIPISLVELLSMLRFPELKALVKGIEIISNGTRKR